MMKYSLTFLVALLLALPCVAQVGLSAPPLPPMDKGYLLGRLGGTHLSGYPVLGSPGPSAAMARPPSLGPVAGTHAYQMPKQAFFCRWETKMEKAARVPVKFRLGEVQYTEGLEGKRD